MPAAGSAGAAPRRPRGGREAGDHPTAGAVPAGPDPGGEEVRRRQSGPDSLAVFKSKQRLVRGADQAVGRSVKIAQTLDRARA